MPCDKCLNRRAFLSTAVSTAGLTVLASCGDGDLMALAPSLPGEFDPTTITVGDFPGLANTGVLVAIPGRSFVVKRTGPSTFLALSTRCTHQGCTVNITNAGQRLDCPCHGSQFSSDGVVLRPPAQDPLPTFATTYNPGTDQLTIS